MEEDFEIDNELNEEQEDQLEGLIYETILPALHEDFDTGNFDNEGTFRAKAIEYIIEGLTSM